QINQLKHKNYHVKYMSDTDKVFSINLIDESKITLLETGGFAFLSKEFEMKSNAGEWAYIIDKEQKNKIARCKSPITSPFLVYFELLDENYKENELLFLGILHTYLYGG
ncbi:tubby C-terminal domain-like protein, partial [Staphylococcus condimenti]|uniref:tubby C-terminal domain-like protein n=1 Tax=Staphylococcus condimenti TaxID=70255 RepID=UPI0010EE7A9C